MLINKVKLSADVVLSHALLNGNKSLIEFLLQHGVPLTLEHFKVALKVNSGRSVSSCQLSSSLVFSQYNHLLSESLLEPIKAGAPFTVSREEATDARSTSTLSTT